MSAEQHVHMRGRAGNLPHSRPGKLWPLGLREGMQLPAGWGWAFWQRHSVCIVPFSAVAPQPLRCLPQRGFGEPLQGWWRCPRDQTLLQTSSAEGKALVWGKINRADV